MNRYRADIWAAELAHALACVPAFCLLNLEIHEKWLWACAAMGGALVGLGLHFLRVRKRSRRGAAIGVSQGLTDWKPSAEAQNEERYKLIIENMDDAYWEVDLSGRYTFFNESTAKLHCRSREELMGLDYRRYMNEETARHVFSLFNRVYRTGEPARGVAWEITAGDGTRHVFESTVSLMRDSAGNAIGFRGISRDVTERRRLEEELRRSEERYRTIIEGMADSYWETDLAGNFTFFNDAVARGLRRTREELMGCSNKQYMDAATAKEVGRVFKQVYLTGEPERGFAYELIRGDGTKYYAESTISVRRDAEGNVVGFAGVSRDVTERKRMEEALRQSEERYRNIIQQMKDAYWENDLAGNMVFMNDYALELHGRTREEMIGLNNRHYMDEETCRAVGKVFKRIYETGEPAWGVGWEIRRGDGTRRFIEANVSLITDSEGKPTGFRGVSRDVTERRRMETALRRSQASLAQAQRVARLGNWDWDLASGEIVWSDECYRILGYAPQSFRLTMDAFFECIHPQDREPTKRAIERALGEHRPYSMDHRIVRPGGAERFVNQQGEVVVDEASNPVRLVGTIQDITERKRSERKLESIAAKLELSNSELESFAYVASHDLQEPLRKIRTFGDRLRTKCAGAIGADGLAYLERMESAASRMQDLIDALLGFSRVRTAAQPFVEVDLTRVATDVLSDLEVRIEQTGGRVEVGELPVIQADPTQMRQLLQNLISNALKFHKPGEPPLVKLSSQPVSGHEPLADGSTNRLFRITVEDSGIGFDEKYLDQIFVPFKRLHGREYEGTGIGLSTCLRIVQRHNGTITASSSPGRGSTFIITLPSKQCD